MLNYVFIFRSTELAFFNNLDLHRTFVRRIRSLNIHVFFLFDGFMSLFHDYRRLVVLTESEGPIGTWSRARCISRDVLCPVACVAILRIVPARLVATYKWESVDMLWELLFLDFGRLAWGRSDRCGCIQFGPKFTLICTGRLALRTYLRQSQLLDWLGSKVILLIWKCHLLIFHFHLFV